MGPPAKSKRALRLRLYVAGNGPNSLRAIANLNALCAEHFASRYELEIVDLLAAPERGVSDGIIVTPTLLKLEPPPRAKVVGNLDDAARVLLVLSAR